MGLDVEEDLGMVLVAPYPGRLVLLFESLHGDGGSPLLDGCL